jgi:uncharacterized RDD family membrane protein YckC
MSLAGAPTAAPIDLTAATRQALPRRLGALIVDSLVISLLEAIVNNTFGVTRVTSGVVTSMTTGSFSSFTTQTTVDWFWLTLLWVAYYAVLEGLFGQTIGKRLAAVRVTDPEGRPIGWQAAILRNLGRLLDALPFLYLLGGILTLSSRQHQRLGDRFARTIVVPAGVVVHASSPPSLRRRRAIALTAAVAVLLAFCAWFDYFGRPPLVIEGAKNTGTSLFGRGIGSYTLGPARWGNGTVTYPITDQIAQTGQSCAGEITLAWNGFLTGWQIASARGTCTRRFIPNRSAPSRAPRPGGHSPPAGGP